MPCRMKKNVFRIRYTRELTVCRSEAWKNRKKYGASRPKIARVGAWKGPQGIEPVIVSGMDAALPIKKQRMSMAPKTTGRPQRGRVHSPAGARKREPNEKREKVSDVKEGAGRDGSLESPDAGLQRRGLTDVHFRGGENIVLKERDGGPGAGKKLLEKGQVF